jgi:septum formation protein
MSVRLVLASASPARLSTLRNAGLDPAVVVSGVDESSVVDPDPGSLALRLAELKGRAVAGTALPLDRDDAGDSHRDRVIVVACDSVFEFEGTAYGKPGSKHAARKRLLACRGRSGTLHTGHFVIDPHSGASVLRGASTLVTFATMSDDDIHAYVDTGEPVEVAGAFTVDGRGGAFVRGVVGDHHNVVGLSLPLLRDMLAELGVWWPSLWQRD